MDKIFYLEDFNYKNTSKDDEPLKQYYNAEHEELIAIDTETKIVRVKIIDSYGNWRSLRFYEALVNTAHRDIGSPNVKITYEE